MSRCRPTITSTSDYKLFHDRDGETSQFIRSTFIHFDSDDYAWMAVVTQEGGTRGLTFQNIENLLREVPDEDAYPEAPPSVTILEDDPGQYFIKRPQTFCLPQRSMAPLVPQIMKEEVEILEILKQHPHPNIVPYHGCVVKRGRITGIALRRYESILSDRFQRDASEFNVEAFEAGLQAALRHVHALGLAHNDINPANIALDENDLPVVIDWGSCKPFDADLITAGSIGWIDEEFTVSKQYHDISATEKVVRWVRETLSQNRKAMA